MSNLLNLMLRLAAAAASAGDWTSVAAALNATIGVPRAGKWQYLEVLSVIGESDFRHALEVMRADQIGRRGVELLELPTEAGGGLDVSHPLTRALLQRLSAVLRPGVATRLLALGTATRASGLEADVTADQCRIAWESAAIAARITNAAALASERITAADTDQQRAAQWAQAWEDAT